MRTLNDLQHLLKSRGLERLIPRAAELVAPSIRLVLEPYPAVNPLSVSYALYPNDETPIGCSKVGGLPDLPPDFIWPETEEGALPYLAQIRLEEVGAFDFDGDLPHSGMLTFFFDEFQAYDFYGSCSANPSKDICQVFHFKNDSILERRLFPDNVRRLDGVTEPENPQNPHDNLIYWAPLSIQFRRELNVAHTGALEFENVAEELGLSDDEREIWWQLSIDWHIENAKAAYLEIAKHKLRHQMEPHHQLLGLPYCGNFDGRTMIAGENKRHEDSEWRLLFQLSSDGWLNWGDAGIISFFIRGDALRSGDFDDIRLSHDG